MIAMDHAVLLTQAGAEIVATCATVQVAVDCIRDKLVAAVMSPPPSVAELPNEVKTRLTGLLRSLLERGLSR